MGGGSRKLGKGKRSLADNVVVWIGLLKLSDTLTATMSNDSIVKFRPFDKVETN